VAAGASGIARGVIGNFYHQPDMALEAIAEVGLGGHHFGTLHTQERYENAFHQPFVTDRQAYDAWHTEGEQDASRRANGIWKQWLREYVSPPVELGVETAL
jgi:trimethylamine--corrinoid protein Co-methyltransferase